MATEESKKERYLKPWQLAAIVGVLGIAYAIQEYGRAEDAEGVLANPVFAVGTISDAMGNYKHSPAIEYTYPHPINGETCNRWTPLVCIDRPKSSDELNGVNVGVIYDAFEPCNSLVLRSYDELIRFTDDSLARALEVPKRYRCPG